MELSNEVNEHQRKVFAQMAASAALQAKLAVLDSEPEVITVEHFTEMLKSKTI